MGRPPIGKIAMTSTERVHRFRAKHRKGKPETKQNETEAELHARIRELKAKLEHEHERPARAIEVDPASLPKSYRERFEAMRRRLEQDFEWRVKQRAQEETRRIIEESDLPYWREQVEKA